jgi:methylmalonyl-CoA epimerase
MSFKIKHIAIAVHNIEESKARFALLTDSTAGETFEVPSQKVKVCFIETGRTKLELIQPLNGNVGVNKFLERRGEGLHHICLEVDDIRAVLEDYTSKGIRLIDNEPRIGAEGELVAFVHPASTGGVLIELEQARK